MAQKLGRPKKRKKKEEEIHCKRFPPTEPWQARKYGKENWLVTKRNLAEISHFIRHLVRRKNHFPASLSEIGNTHNMWNDKNLADVTGAGFWTGTTNAFIFFYWLPVFNRRFFWMSVHANLNIFPKYLIVYIFVTAIGVGKILVDDWIIKAKKTYATIPWIVTWNVQHNSVL